MTSPKRDMTMSQTYAIQDTILYGANGVCRVVDIEQKEFAGQKMDYYVLQPVYSDQSRIYVPMHNETLTAKMRRVLSAEEVHRLIREIPQGEEGWIEDENQRRETYRTILSKGDPTEVMRVIRSLYQHQQMLKEQGKKLRQADERCFREAEKLLYDEFALVLNIQPEQVLPFILEQIEIKEKEQWG